MFRILWWVIFGGVVGWVAKKLYGDSKDLVGWRTIALGIAGSFAGGFINWLVGWGDRPLSPSGALMSIVGGVLCCAVYAHWDRIINFLHR